MSPFRKDDCEPGEYADAAGTYQRIDQSIEGKAVGREPDYEDIKIIGEYKKGLAE